MITQALLSTVPLRNTFDRAAIIAHSVMLQHGFTCVGTAEPTSDSAASVAMASDGSASLQILPAGWNASADSYTFGYAHPACGSVEGFTLKALVVGSSLVVHAASSLPGTDLLTVTFNIAADSEISQSGLRDMQDKIAAGIALRLLARQPSTARLGKALDPAAPAATAERSSSAKRPAENDPTRPTPGGIPRGPDRPDRDDRPDPFFPGFPSSPPIWTPYGGGLIGPRHPAWGQVGPGGGRPGIGGGGGMMPRFDPMGPFGDGIMEPNPDHLRVPGMNPGNFPAFQGGATGGGRRDPDDMFIL